MNSINKIKAPTEKNFGLTFSIFFLMLFILLLVLGKTIIILPIISILILILTYFFSSILRVPNYIWHEFGKLISIITNPVIMFIMYYFLFTPYGFIIKFFKRKDTGWHKYDYNDNFNNQF
jgi:hypothetical protein|tara:strand:+ start:2422 stop:2781 length:360 start_codon:yes stop_codon:yes gene_type:complete